MPSADPHSSDEAYDQWLVLRAQAGEQECLRVLVKRWNPRLGRHALRMTDDADGAADVLQEAWLAIVRGLRRLEDPARFRRWAYQIVSRRAVDWVRARQKSRSRAGPLTHDPIDQPEGSDASDSGDRVRGALRDLAERDRIILAMRYADDLPVTEIAEALGVPAGTVKSRLFHARARFRTALEATDPHQRGEER